MQRFYNINGEIVPAESASLKVNDLAILRGFGIFDYFLVWDSVPLFIENYLDRFYNSAMKLNLEVPTPRAALKKQIHELIELNKQSQAAIRLVMTGGYTSDSYTPVRPNLLILHHDFKPVAPKYYEEGMKLMAFEYQRDLPEVKTTNYAMGIRLIPQLNAMGAVEPLYHSNGTIKEAVRSNFFILNKEGTIITSDDEILFGITRMHTLEAVKGHFKIEKRPFTLEEVYEADEAFLTGSNKGVVPVTAVSEHTIGDGKPGPQVKKIIELFDQYRMDYVRQQLAHSTPS